MYSPAVAVSVDPALLMTLRAIVSLQHGYSAETIFMPCLHFSCAVHYIPWVLGEKETVDAYYPEESDIKLRKCV